MTIQKMIPSLLFLAMLIIPTFAQEQLFAFVGSYEGSLLSGDDFIDVVTVFLPQKSGKIAASYTMYEDDQPQPGKLELIKVEGPGIFLFTWVDTYGSGVLRLVFASDGSSFMGYWGLNIKDLSSPWTGLRTQNTSENDEDSDQDEFEDD